MKTTKVKQSIRRVPASELAGLPKGLPAMRRWWKSMGAVPVSPAMKRRLIAAGEWGMPKE